MTLTFHPFQLELKHPFTISRWTYTHTESLVVEFRKDGVSGFGEATQNPYYPNTAIDYMVERLQTVEKVIVDLEKISPLDFWATVSPHLTDCPFALCALDQAYHDWYTKTKGIPLYQYWELNPKIQAPNSYTLSIDQPALMIDRMKQHPWKVYKIKLGTDNDIELVKTLREHTDSTFWVDANCAWTVTEAIQKSKELAQLGVTIIEQPLPADQWEEMEEVFQKSAIPVFADESCKTFSDIEKCKNRFHGINIKAMKCGGLTPTLKMIKEAKSKNFKVMVGCMAESTVGISAIAHLCPLIDYADMDGQYFIKNDPATGVKVTGDGFIFPDRNGTGVLMNS